MSSDDFFDEWIKKKLDQQKPKPAPEPKPAADTNLVWMAFIEALKQDTPRLREIDGFNQASFQLPDPTKGGDQPCSMSVTYNEPRTLTPHLAILFFHYRQSQIECYSQTRGHLVTLDINGSDSTIYFRNKWETPETAAGKFVIWVSETLSGGGNL